jgi:chemotaxis protein methyltransferase CheR
MSNIDQVELEGSSLNKVLSLVHKLTGISMGVNKKTLIQGRLRPRIRQLGLESYDKYLDYLSSNKSEIQEFINLVTTNETSFFRTQRVWEYFTKDFLPNWWATNSKKTLKIWSGASSTGEEVYTIGICCEEFRIKNPGFNYQIFGSDISSDVLAIAQKAEYAGRSIEVFKTSNRPLFDKYMLPNGENFNVHPDVKLKIRFGIHNLFTLPKEFNHYDIVFLRNVLIYFEPADIEKVLANISKGLIYNGILIIGESESLSSLKTNFKYKLPLVYTNEEQHLGP